MDAKPYMATLRGFGMRESQKKQILPSPGHNVTINGLTAYFHQADIGSGLEDPAAEAYRVAKHVSMDRVKKGMGHNIAATPHAQRNSRF